MGEADDRRDYYTVLGAEQDDSRDEIERRYKRLAVEHHPDRGGDEEEMKSINEAWGVLRDDAAREAYDATRTEAYDDASRSRAYDASRSRAYDTSRGRAYDTSRSRAYDVTRSRAYNPPDFVPSTSEGAQADALGGRLAGALLSLFAGVVLIFLVRFHYVVFLWPLALLGLSLLFFGVWMAHAALAYARAGYAPTHLARRLAWAQETVFWLAVAGGGYALYVLLTAI